MKQVFRLTTKIISVLFKRKGKKREEKNRYANFRAIANVYAIRFINAASKCSGFYAVL